MRPLTSVLVVLLAVVLLVCFSASAALINGQNGCVGFDLSSSKYCSPLRRPCSAQRPTRNSSSPCSSSTARTRPIWRRPGTFRALVSKPSHPPQSLTSVFEQQVLANLSNINNAWFKCPYATRGVQLSLTLYCGMLLNPNPNFYLDGPSACVPRQTADNTAGPGLCNSSTAITCTDGISSYDKDTSCSGLDIPKAKVGGQIIYSVVQSLAGAKAMFFSQDGSCVDAVAAEKKFGMCGWPTRYAACQNGCASTTLGDCASIGPSDIFLADALTSGGGSAAPSGNSTSSGGTQSLPGSSTLAIVLGSVGGMLLIGAVGVAMFMLRRASDMKKRAEYVPTGHADPADAGNGTKAAKKTSTGSHATGVPSVGPADINIGHVSSPLLQASLPQVLPSTDLGSSGDDIRSPLGDNGSR
ncbi:hypothetical protein BC828DRAFT_219423 [Blastocladiella britannica]|nr:hypothetical protein BC828DRAFT_219423 [Blastocladiella britannica]